MKYPNIRAGTFLARPNRFVAQVEVEGNLQVCHVKNTGRCRELLVPGCRVYLVDSHNPVRKTRFDLVAVEKEGPAGPLLIQYGLPGAQQSIWGVGGRRRAGVCPHTASTRDDIWEF